MAIIHAPAYSLIQVLIPRRDKQDTHKSNNSGPGGGKMLRCIIGEKPMNKILSLIAALLLVTACSRDQSTEPAVPLTSGVDLAGMDMSVRPQDDYYAYANGTWLKQTEIPADQFGWGSYITLRDDGLADVKAIVDEVAADVSESEAAAKIGNNNSA
jgi:hypothetical protein